VSDVPRSTASFLLMNQGGSVAQRQLAVLVVAVLFERVKSFIEFVHSCSIRRAMYSGFSLRLFTDLPSSKCHVL
jgi:hypothetical protein